jgi:hypothetical protein
MHLHSCTLPDGTTLSGEEYARLMRDGSVTLESGRVVERVVAGFVPRS